jgi:serine/threonine-protein kinase
VGAVFADRYTIAALLGEGGMGSVYRAYDAKLDRYVALKIVRAVHASGSEGSTTNARSRLIREARTAAGVMHPNAVAIYDVGEFEGTAYIAMELIEGRTMRSYIGDATIPLETRLLWLRDIARALSAAHQRGVVHRDVKPENVMIGRDGVVKMLDFGIARRTDVAVEALAPTQRAIESVVTGSASIVGTPFYMSPEQIHGGTVDARADEFAWGVTAHELLTGELPWGRERNPLSAIADMFSTPPRRVRDTVPDVPEPVQAAILRALARSPSGRFETMSDLLVSAFGVDSRMMASMRPIPSARAPRMSARLRTLVYGGVAAATIAVVTIAGRVAVHSRVPATATDVRPDASKAMSITDWPLPASDHPDALEAYADALRQLRGSNQGAAERALSKAVERDPTLAAAHLRRIGVTIESLNDPAPSYRAAISLRTRLSKRDADMLEAYAPLIEVDPPDYEQCARRFDLLEAKYPSDAEIADTHARAEFVRSEGTAAKQAADHALALDPEYADALSQRGRAEVMLGDFAAARADADDCFARFGSVDCLTERVAIAQYTGESELLPLARKLQMVAPDSQRAAWAVVSALFQRDAGVGALRAAIAPALDAMPPARRASTDAKMAILAGDFVEARKHFDEWRKDAPPLLAKQARLAWFQVTLDEEMGETELALRDAQAFVDAMPAFARARMVSVSDPIIPILRVLRDHGKMAEEEYDRQRSAFIARAQAGKDGRPLVWILAYAEAARTPEEAAEALSVLPSYGIPVFEAYGGAALGHVRALAGDWQGARDDLERAAHAAAFLENPYGPFRAMLELGRVLERAGDAAGACAQYKKILLNWGAAKPRSMTASQARERVRALGCDAAH